MLKLLTAYPNQRVVGLISLAATVLPFCLSCSLPPSEVPQRLIANAPEHYLNSTQTDDKQSSPAEGELDHWWEVFDQQKLNEILEQVLSDNPSLVQAFARLDQLYAAETIASSSLWPTFQLAATVDRNRRNQQAFIRVSTPEGSSGSSSVTATTYRISIPVQYEVDIWGRNLSASKAAELESLAGQQDLLAISMSIAAETVENYFLAVELCNQIELVEQTIESDRRFYQLVEKRYRIGVSTPLDVLQARQNLSARAAEKPKFALQLEKARNNLAILAGDYPRPVTTCFLEQFPANLPTIPAGIPADLLIRRPDVRSSLLLLESADFRAAQAMRSRLPSLNLGASGGYEDLDFSDLFRPDTLVWRILGDAGLVIFDGGTLSARVEQQVAISQEREAAFTLTTLNAFREVEDALAGEKLLRERVELLNQKVQTIGETLRLSAEQYLQGLSEYLPVLVAQGTYYAAQSELLSAKRQLVSNHVQLARALGGGWSDTELDKVYQYHHQQRRE